MNKETRARLLAIETFQKIPGIGFVHPFLRLQLSINSLSWTFRERTATNLVNAGTASVSDLRLPQYEVLLKPNQKVGVLDGEYMATPVPRTEAEEIVVRTLCVNLSFVRLMFTATKAFIRDHISRKFEIHLTVAK